MSLKDYRTILQKVLAEGASQTFGSPIVDGEGEPIDSAALSAMTMTLYDAATGTIINARDDTNILNANGGSVQAGAWALDLTPEDMAIITPASKTEVHVLLVEWTQTNGKKGKAEIVMTVANLTKVP